MFRELRRRVALELVRGNRAVASQHDSILLMVAIDSPGSPIEVDTLYGQFFASLLGSCTRWPSMADGSNSALQERGGPVLTLGSEKTT